MVSYDWANDGAVGVFFRHGMVSGLWGELVLLQGMGMKFKDKIMLQGCREGYYEYDPPQEFYVGYMMFQVNHDEYV